MYRILLSPSRFMLRAAMPNRFLSARDRAQNPSPCEPGITVFCDFDGPIMDVSDRYYSTYQLGLADTQAFYQAQGETLPLQALSKQQFWQMKQDRIPDTEIALQSGLSQEHIKVFLGQVCEIVNRPALLQQDQLQPQVHRALSLLHTRDIQLILVTLRPQIQAQQVLQQHGLAQFFAHIYGTEPEYACAAYRNQSELKTQLLAKAIADCCPPDWQREAAWMIGDTEADVLAGQTSGISTIALTCGIRSTLYLQQFDPTLILGDLLDAAHYLNRYAAYHHARPETWDSRSAV